MIIEPMKNANSSNTTKLTKLKVTRDLLIGADTEEVRQAYRLIDLDYHEALETGLTITCEVLGLRFGEDGALSSLKHAGGRDMWIYRVMEAIEVLRANQEVLS